jgi:hypothetical protein
LTSARLLRAVTGFSRDEFYRFLPSFAVTYHEAVARERGDRPRRRRTGGGRKGQLSAMADKLLFILVYVHLYPIQEVPGVLFILGLVYHLPIHRTTPSVRHHVTVLL